MAACLLFCFDPAWIHAILIRQPFSDIHPPYLRSDSRA